MNPNQIEVFKQLADMLPITLSNESAMVAATAAVVACAVRYWQLRAAELNKSKDVGNQFKSTKPLSLKDMIVIGKNLWTPSLVSLGFMPGISCDVVESFKCS